MDNNQQIKPIGLSQLVLQVKDSLAANFNFPFWIIAEISEMNVNHTGHCYIELIEKENSTGRVLAKSRATIWSHVYRILKPYFETTTGQELKPGLKILVKVSVGFHEVFGFSLNITDIDPQYTIGDIEQRRLMIINKLKDDGVYQMNKDIELPIVPQRVAVISSETAAGYGDFIDQIKNNQFGIKFYVKLFQSVMQGDKTVGSIIDALNNIFDQMQNFDVVVILRGGGAKSDLFCFDNYDLACNIAQFPLPVITGIGHERDQTIIDLVANTSLKTPTAVAEFLIDTANSFFYNINDLQNRLKNSVTNLLNILYNKNNDLIYRLQMATRSGFDNEDNFIDSKKHKLVAVTKQFILIKNNQINSLGKELRYASKTRITNRDNDCNNLKKRLKSGVNNYFMRKNNILNSYNEKNRLIDPQNILNRGYSIVKHNNKVLTNTNNVKINDNITVVLAKGKFDARVTDVG